MNPILINNLLLICFGCLLLPQSGLAARIKRSTTETNVTTNSNNTVLPLMVPVANITVPAIAIEPQAKIVNISEAAAVTAAAAATNAAATEAVAKKTQELMDDLSGCDYMTGSMQRTKRRHHNAGGSNAVPPYVYYNKLVSPDGKQELKEFQLLGPNVVIESMQHDMNFGGVAPGSVASDVSGMGGMLLLNSENNLNGHINGMAKPKHHRKHKSSLSLPPFLFMLQQMMQPNLNLDMLEAPMQRNRMDAPLLQFLDSAVDNALRNSNRELYDREREIELIEKVKEKDNVQPMQKTDGELKKKDKMPSFKDDELVLSCPIHHEHHASNNGEIVDDDVVLVNECHII